MKDKGKRKRYRREQESHGLAKDAALIERQLRTWKRRAAFLGLAQVASVCSVLPFLAGHSLHRYFGEVGKPLLIASMCLLWPFLYAAGTVYNLWNYQRAIRRIHCDAGSTRTETQQRTQESEKLFDAASLTFLSLSDARVCERNTQTKSKRV